MEERKDFFSFKIRSLKSNPPGTGTKSNSDTSALIVLLAEFVPTLDYMHASLCQLVILTGADRRQDFCLAASPSLGSSEHHRY